MRLLVVSTSGNTDRILSQVIEQADGRTEVALHLGNKDAQIKASALARMDTRAGSDGHPFADQRWTGVAQTLLSQPTFVEGLEEFIDTLQRRGPRQAYRSHPMREMQDYVDYYHILADVIGQMMIDRGVTHCLFFNVPHLTYDTVAWQVARALGLPCLIVTQSLFPGRFFSMRDPMRLGLFPANPDAPPHPIKRGSKPDLFYMQGVKQEREHGGTPTWRGMIQLAAFLITKRPLKALNPVYLYRLVRDFRRVYGTLPKWRDPFARFFHEDDLAYFDHIARFEDQAVNMEGDFVYFALQMQPEMTTAALGGHYTDQALAIERLAALLPAGVRILVKENPKQSAYMRGPLFFHRLSRIPSVTILPSWADTHALTARARFVATITGTVGWEAIRQGKPALVFGAAWYRGFPGVHDIEDDPTWDDVAGDQIDHDALQQAVGALLARSHRGVVERHYAKTVDDFDEQTEAYAAGAAILALLEGRSEVTFPDA